MRTEPSAPLSGAGGRFNCPPAAPSLAQARTNNRGPLALIFLLLAGTSAPAWGAVSEDFGEAQSPAGAGPDDQQTIVVTGIRDLLADVPPERSLDEDSIAGYGVDTVEDLIGEIGAEVGDDEQPIVLVNGERVENLDEIAGYPVEALTKLEVLPRGSGAPVGGSPRQRVYSLTLRNQMRSLAVSASWRAAIEGDWTARRGEAIFTRIQGPDRINVTFRIRDEDDLLESDRGIVQPPVAITFDVTGNIIPDPRTGSAEIDPFLSALAGVPVTVAAVPSGTISPSLAAFAANANRANELNLGRFRSLRSTNEGYDLIATMNKRLSPRLRLSLNGRMGWSDSRSLLGLPSATFIIPAAGPSSPFSTDVGLALFGREPLGQRFSSFTGSANGTLNANVGRWLLTLIGNYSHGERRTRTDRQEFAQVAQPILIDTARNPFAGDLGDLLLVFPDRSQSLLDNGGLQFRTVGSPLTLPAGPLRLTLSTGFNFSRIATRNSNNMEELRRFSRNETSFRASADIPLTSRRTGFLSEIGDLSANLEFGMVDFSGVGTFTRHILALIWLPLDWLRINASTSSNPRAPDVSFIAAPVVATQGSRYFDFLTGETVDVTQISGGNSLLRPERLETDRLTVNASPLARINLQLQAEYSRIRTDGFISGVPPASAAIQLAFPERYVRDANGRLTIVDVRPVNFERQSQEQLRYGFSFSLPIGRAAAPTSALQEASDGEASADDESGEVAVPVLAPVTSGSRARLQFSVSHTILLDNEVLIRPGLAQIDLLAGGAIGIAGSPPRHLINANMMVSSRGIGVSMTSSYRSESRILVQTPASTGVLHFSPIATFNLRAFVEGRRIFPDVGWMRGARFTLSVVNIGNNRQTVRDELGVTPLRYQPAYRDPLGRTVEIGIRKLF